MAEKKARGLRLGETGNEGAVPMEKENSPHGLRARRYPCLAVALPASFSFPFNSIRHSLFGLKFGNEILIVPLCMRISCCALYSLMTNF